MDTENLLQINDFSGGMNTDTSDGAIASKLYRMAKNLRYVTNTQENSGELHMIEGLGDLVSTGRRVVASTLIRNIGVLVYESDNGWGVLTFKPKAKELTEVCNIQNTDRVVGLKLSLVTSYEDNNNCKLYIADGKGPIIVVQLFSGKYYTALEDVESYPSVTFTVPIYCGLITGTLKSGVYAYSYQLYNKYGTLSEISPSTKLIPLRDGNKGYAPDKITNCGIKIKIESNSSFDKFEKMRIFRIRYAEVGLMPTIEVAYDGKIIRDFYFEDLGTQSLSILSQEEYNSMTGVHIIPKTIESKDGYLFAANIKTDNPIYAFNSVREWKPDVNIEFVYSKIAIDSYATKNKIDDQLLYGVTVNEEDVSDSIKYGVEWSRSELSSYRNTKVSYALKSLRRGETYRYGIILYDEKGNSSAVFWIGDVDVKDNSLLDRLEYPAWKLEDDTLYAYPIGVKITINNLPQEAVAYEIVRCNRGISDTRNICQGVISRPISRYFNDDVLIDARMPLTPSGLMTTNDIFAGITFKDPYKYYENPSTGLPVENLVTENLRSGQIDDFEYKRWSATNVSSKDTENGRVYQNDKIFLVASPEYSYLDESTKDLLTQYNKHLDTICEIKPQFKYNPITISYEHNWVNNDGIDVFGLHPKNDNVEKCDFLKIEDGSVAIPCICSNTSNKSFLYFSPYWTAALFAYFDFNTQNIIQPEPTTELPSYWSTRYLYMKMYNKNPEEYRTEKDIETVGFPETLNWDDYASPNQPDYKLIYVDKVVNVGGRNYINWICGGLYNQGVEEYEKENRLSKTGDSLYRLSSTDSKDKFRTFGGGLEGPGGKCFVVSLSEDGDDLILNNKDQILSTYLCNITKDAVPYGGTSQQAINNSTYYSYGDYFISGVTDKVLQNGSREVIVFDGDTFIEPFEYISMHKYFHPAINYPRNFCIVYSIPVETSINLAYTYGCEFSRNVESGKASYILNSPSNVNGNFVQDKPLYLYDSAYSANPTYRSAVSIDREDYEFDTNLDYRVYHSLLKSNNEYVDNWLKFLPANYLDLETRKGPITGLRRFHNKLIFWQSEATGVLSVNERTAITDDSNLPLILGTGGVLARYDYFPTSNGMKINEYCDAQSDNVLYWWDHNKGEICAYLDNQGILPLSKVKFVLNYLNKVMQDGRDISDPIVSFDNNFNEAIFTISNESLVYNEHIGQFTSVYEIEPKCCMNILDDVFYVDKNDQSSIYKWNTLYNKAVYGFNGLLLTPYIKCIINKQPTYTKVFDNGEFAGRVYGGDDLSPITLKFKTPLKLFSYLNGSDIQNREYNFKYIVPRNLEDRLYPLYGGRLRGKFMQQELESSSNSYDFSLQYIATKFRVSWS